MGTSLAGSSFDRFTVPVPRVTSHGDTTVIWLSGEQDLASVGLLRFTLIAARERPAHVIVDLAGVTFIDTSTLRALVDAMADSRSTDWALTVRQPSTCVRRLLELCGRSESFDGR